MSTRSAWVLLFAIGMGCGSPDGASVGEVTAPVVYGADDRLEVFEHPDAELRRIAEESILALIPSFRISREPSGDYSFFTRSLADLRDLCADERFADQPTAAACSGVLIDDDLVLTAGHCIDEHTPCDTYAYVFNYRLAEPGRLAEVRDEDVYQCARVVIQGNPEGSDFTPDFTVIQLDRPVEGAQSPVAIRPAVPFTEQDPLAMIGFGSGLPAKIDSGAAVADPRAEELDFFVANLDAFQGHSGSATFDANRRLAGILIGGRTPDYVSLAGETCTRVAVYEDGQAGEIVQNISPVVAALCQAGWDAVDLCDPKACDGELCGFTPPPPPGPTGAVAGDSAGCSAATGSTGWLSACWGILLFAAARRFRRRAA